MKRSHSTVCAARQRRLDHAAAGGRAAPRTPAAPRSARPSARAAPARADASASGVPPGSRVTHDVVRRARAAVRRARSMCVDLPAPSMPSKVMKRPRSSVLRLRALVLVHRAIVVGEVVAELAACRRRARRSTAPSSAPAAPRRAATRGPASRSASAAGRRACRCCTGVSASRSRLRRLPSKRVAEAVDHRRVGLQRHAACAAG